jgi:hypothetical protein
MATDLFFDDFVNDQDISLKNLIPSASLHNDEQQNEFFLPDVEHLTQYMASLSNGQTRM